MTVITEARLDTGSTGGTYDGQSIPLMAPTVYCSNDTTPAEPGYVTLDAVGTYLVSLTVTNAAGNTDTAFCTVSVAARTDPEIYVAPDGDDSSGTNWVTAYTSVYDAVAQSVGGDTIYIKGGAVYLNACDATFNDCTIADTYSVGNSTIYGSGMYVLGGQFSMVGGTIHNRGSCKTPTFRQNTSCQLAKHQ